jgi:ribosome-binding protein aMBF1 (putative translation factor)
MRTKSFEKFLEKKLKNKSFRKKYEAAQPLMAIAVSISKAREAMQISQSQLAARLGTTQSVISRIESGNQNLSIEMLSRIAAVLDCHLSVGLTPIRRKAA